VSGAARFVSRARAAKTKVLVVEDDDELRRTLVEALESDGASVWGACNGVVAERILFDDGGHRFDVVVTDIRMPGRTGLDVLRSLRARGSTIPVILMSGFADGAALAEQTASPRVVLFSKPFDIDDLRTAVLNIDAVVGGGGPPRGHVLVAEDDHELRQLVALALRDEGFAVRTATDGQSMIELLESSAREDTPPPDALVMDICMPHYDGLEVLRALRLSRWNVPVVLMTAFPDEQTLQLAAQLGAACTLAKPVEMDELVRAVTIVTELAKRRALSE